MATPELASCMVTMKVGTTATGQYEMTKLSKEQWIEFRYFFIEERMKN
jgi:hypothetical protein